MLALASVWIGVASLVLATAMVVHRPFFTDLNVVLVLWLGAPGSMCLAGLVLWAYRKDTSGEPGIAARRLQAKVAIALAILAAAIVYGLIMSSQKIAPTAHP